MGGRCRPDGVSAALTGSRSGEVQAHDGAAAGGDEDAAGGAGGRAAGHRRRQTAAGGQHAGHEGAVRERPAGTRRAGRGEEETADQTGDPQNTLDGYSRPIAFRGGAPVKNGIAGCL